MSNHSSPQPSCSSVSASILSIFNLLACNKRFPNLLASRTNNNMFSQVRRGQPQTRTQTRTHARADASESLSRDRNARCLSVGTLATRWAPMTNAIQRGATQRRATLVDAFRSVCNVEHWPRLAWWLLSR